MNNKVGFIFTTRDRINLTKQILQELDQPDSHFDLIWIDGSKRREAKKLPMQTIFKHCNFVKAYYNTTGPDHVIAFGLRALLNEGYEYCGIIENDICLEKGWFTRMMRLFDEGRRDGFRVGAVTLRTMESRVLEIREYERYALMWNLGAAITLFSQETARIIYNVCYDEKYNVDAKGLRKFYKQRFGVDLKKDKKYWELFMDEKNRPLGYDWGYAMEIQKKRRGDFYSLAPIPSMAFNRDEDIAKYRTKYL